MLSTTKDLQDKITEKRNTLRTDRLDMSFGELMSLYSDENTLFINPEYQRAFRWDASRQTKFIESILLGIPIPPIFVAEDAQEEQTRWELVDGLQRISTVFSFFGILRGVGVPPEKNNLVLEEGGLIGELKGYSINTFPPTLKFAIKRAVCRVEIIRWDSSSIDMRYELFNRLNTGGTALTPQEIRNCIFRGFGNDLNRLLIEISKSPAYQQLILPTDKQKEEMYCEELVLRFFTLKNHSRVLDTNLDDHLSTYMKNVTEGKLHFDVQSEKQLLEGLVTFLVNNGFDHKIFRASNGIFTPAYYDAIMLSLAKYFDFYEKNPDVFKEKVEIFKNDEDYRSISSKSYSRDRIENRVKRAFEIFKP